jgi:hypothetical protein
LYLARARRNAGRLLDARTSLKAIAAEPMAEGAPPPWKQAQIDARAELAAVEAAIPTIVIAADPEPRGATATIDGRSAPVETPIEVDPGTHRITLSTSSATKELDVEVRAGERQRRIEVAPPPAALPPAIVPRTERQPPRSEGSLVPGAIVLGFGLAGLGVGAVTGGLALSANGDATALCEGGACPADREEQIRSDLDGAGTLADVSTVSFIAGGALTAVGVVLVIARPFGGSEVAAGTSGLRLRGAF